MSLSLLAQIPSIILSIAGISFIIVFHEFGHYIFCKLFKVHTPTFSIGMGKVLFSKKIGDTNFCVSAAPIGGYVEVASESSKDGLGFNDIAYYQKVLMMLGGIAFNFMLTYLIFVGLYFTGMPESGAGARETNTTIISAVPTDSINASMLQAGDQLIALGGHSLDHNLAQARKIISDEWTHKATTVSATLIRCTEQVQVDLYLKGEKTPPSLTKQLEITLQAKPPLSLSCSIVAAYQATGFYLQAIAKGLKDMVFARNTKGLVGPVMAVAASSKSAQKGLTSLLFLLAIISINLGFMNLLPLPIFDGGQFVIFTIEAVLRRQLSERVRNMIGTSSWVLAIGLLVIFTVRDLYMLCLGQ